MAKEFGKVFYIYYNNVLNDYSVGCRSFRKETDSIFHSLQETINYLYENINKKRKITIVSNASEQDFLEIKSELEKKLRRAKFINRKF